MTREEAIETLKANYPDACFEQLREAVDTAIEALKAQIDKDTNVPTNDCISRKAAIDILYDFAGCIVDTPNGDYHKAYKAYRHRLEILPSAQPEHTCVNCGRTVNNGGWYADGRTKCPIEEHYALPKDGYCHLWEKRNVTDDDYPERREE